MEKSGVWWNLFGYPMGNATINTTLFFGDDRTQKLLAFYESQTVFVHLKKGWRAELSVINDKVKQLFWLIIDYAHIINDMCG